MGLCGSSLSEEEQKRKKEEQKRSKELEKQMTAEHSADQQINKLLLLGAGESGKSTLFKQMITIYGKGFDDAERKNFTSVIFNNIITSMKTLLAQVDAYGGIQGDAAKGSRAVLEQLKEDDAVTAEIAGHINTLWSDAGVQNAYENRANFQLTDSAKYFFDKIMEVGSGDYLPSEQDVLRSRVRTTGIVENEFVIDGNQFKMFDVGGQRNERKKWIHCFENVTCVIFVVAISAYDQVLYEDENTNRLEEAMNLFDEICNSRWFRKTSIILFLNKRDLFAEKILKVPLTVCFPDYNRENNYEQGTAFIEEQFLALNKNEEKQIYSHIVCATDTTNVAAVFDAVKDIIIRKSLDEAGLM